MTKLPYLVVILGLFSSLPGYADDTVDITKMSLDQLQNVEVTSVSKKSERAFDAAAAIYVITKQDIKRSGATSVPEALRLAPGMQVARVGTDKWAISIRGFNDQFSNKLLVLIDGRSVYTPLFSGVYWDVQDIPLEDVKQIEVIRGPGATLWGSNAVNGVINIITEEAVDTHGKFVSTTVGNKEDSITTRVGDKVGDDVFYRIYGKYTRNAQETFVSNGKGAGDDSSSGRSGFRVDWEKSINDFVTVQGDVYRNGENQVDSLPTLSAPFRITTLDQDLATGGNTLARWKHTYASGADSTLQMYVDHTARNNLYWKQLVDTADIDFQHSLPVMYRQEVTMGTGYRLISDHISPTPYVYFIQDSKQTSVFSAFIQDKIHLIENRLFLTLGSKYEDSFYVKNQFQPSARLSLKPADNQTIWASVSKADRVPNRTMDYITYNVAGTPRGFAGLVGSNVAGIPEADSEQLVAYETGYRIQPIKELTFDFTTYYNDYKKLASYVSVPGMPLRQAPGNDISGESHGFEISSTWQVNHNWDVSANYTLLRMNLSVPNATPLATAGKNPQNQYNITSHYVFPHNIEMNNTLYYVSDLPAISVPSYTRFDTGFTWKPKQYLELSLVGQNLFNSSQFEYTGFTFSLPERIGRSVYANAKITF